MSSRLSLVTLAVTAVVTALSAAPQTAQPPAPKGQQPPTFRTEANFVRVDVFPTLDGKPLKGLKAEDFELLEDGVPQKVSTFEHVEVRAGLTQEERVEPNTIAESRDALKNPRARVFVLYLDVPHVTMDGAWHVREPLVRLIDRVLGPDDLVGIMTPHMAASDVVFARKTQVVSAGLRDRWPWGERHTIAKDDREWEYWQCYPYEATKDVIREMEARKRERQTLSALKELVTWLRDEREERKAILTVTEGWLLYRPNSDLTRLRVIDPTTGAREPVPGIDPIGVDPRNGKLSTRGNSSNSGLKSECDRDRVALSMMNNDQYFKELIDDANRANASFYMIDPRGLPVWDTGVNATPEPPPHSLYNRPNDGPVSNDFRRLTTRHDSMHVLANNTDGMAVLNSNDIDKGLRRISDDLTSYYLLGYYSTNTKLDGRFRAIKVKVTRPNVAVRARRGYKAATQEEVDLARAAAAAPPVDLGPRSATTTALSGLGAIRPGAPVHIQAIAVRGVPTTVWVAGEFPQAPAAATSAILTVSTVGATNSAEVPIAAGQRGFVVPVTLKVEASGPIDIRVRVAAAGAPALTDMVRIDAGAGLGLPLMFRRGPSTGNRLEPAGQPQFSRTERVRFEIPAGADLKLTGARVLDRNGALIELPVTLGERTDAEGQRWLTADLTLAALAAGDYLVEFTADAQKVLSAIRIINR